ncbi:MAG: preprotein translocase subunit SecG [Elusimicrobia bacterium]|jgi:preprotein translocase subunit SecG|nr:preprotein translocase subunit SecG [Elusimicrobiota bacterium]
MLFSVILSIHVVACVLVILVVLLQSGKGAGFSGIFGGGGSDAVFSAPSGSQFIRKVTTGFAVAFFISSLFLTYLGSRRGVRTVTREFAIPTSQENVTEAETTPKGTAVPAEKTTLPTAPKTAEPPTKK